MHTYESLNDLSRRFSDLPVCAANAELIELAAQCLHEARMLYDEDCENTEGVHERLARAETFMLKAEALVPVYDNEEE